MAAVGSGPAANGFRLLANDAAASVLAGEFFPAVELAAPVTAVAAGGGPAMTKGLLLTPGFCPTAVGAAAAASCSEVCSCCCCCCWDLVPPTLGKGMEMTDFPTQRERWKKNSVKLN